MFSKVFVCLNSQVKTKQNTRNTDDVFKYCIVEKYRGFWNSTHYTAANRVFALFPFFVSCAASINEIVHVNLLN